MKIEDAKIRLPEKVKEGSISSVKRVSAFSENRREEINYISIDKLIPYHNQARRTFDQEDLDNLAKTIELHGVRQPLTVIATKDQHGIFEVVSGERRLRAAKIAGLDRVPCIIIHDEAKAEEIAIIENIHRQDLYPLELGRAYRNLITSGVCASKNDVSRRLGISKSKVIDCIALCDLPEAVQQLLMIFKIDNRDFLREICKITDEQKIIKVINDLFHFEYAAPCAYISTSLCVAYLNIPE
ncbi:MAG: ParB/RepB/Spo0J family partition protein, partial [Alphaproteobacteria bacterium]|nr:ParB/RepB/Spo0J family partition protein [Alphaproteobacteria bacterium]